MQYLAWRVLAGLNERSFMLVGHTKFAPDWCFGLVKQRFRRTKVGCLADIARVVNESAVVNYAQLVGTEDGTVVVPQYDWASFFSTFFRRQAFRGIKKLHHLVFSHTSPGVATVREYTDSQEKQFKLLSDEMVNWTPSPHVLPPEIHPPGLSNDRKLYLFEKIREFCPVECRDIVCPDPRDSLPTPTVTSSPPSLSPPHSPSPPPPPPKRRQRRKNVDKCLCFPYPLLLAP